MNPHGEAPLDATEYAELVRRVHAAVAAALPPRASMLVISRGDAALVEIPGLAGAHFPQDPAGGYAGHHPRDGAAAVAQLEELRRRGAEYLVIPATARWWLDFYGELAEHLASRCELVADAPDACLIYGLRPRVEEAFGEQEVAPLQTSAAQMREYLENLLSADTHIVVLETSEGLAAALAPVRAAALAPDTLSWTEGSSLAGLRRLARDGVEYLVVPRAADEWLERHADIGADIEMRCRKIADQRHLCRVFELKELGGGS